MSVPQGTIETFGFWSPTRLCDCQHPSIVPSGTDSSLKTLTQSGSCRILGYFHQVPTGRPRTTVGRDDHVKTGVVNKVILITGHQSLLTVFLTDQVRPLSGPTQRRLDHLLPRSYRHPVLRGGSWNTYGVGLLLTSYRNVVAPGDRDPMYGSRCVLESGE
jgi:hypothetical protein